MIHRRRAFVNRSPAISAPVYIELLRHCLQSPLQSAAPTASPTSSVSLRLPPSPEGKALGTPTATSAHGPLPPLRGTPGDATGIPRFAPPCAGYDACRYSQSSRVLARQLMDPFRPCGPLSPCAGTAFASMQRLWLCFLLRFSNRQRYTEMIEFINRKKTLSDIQMVRSRAS